MRSVSMTMKSFLLSKYPHVFLFAVVALLAGHVTVSWPQSSAERISSGRVIAVIPPDSPPTYFLDVKTGKPAGFAVDIMNKVAERAGLHVDYIFAQSWTEISRKIITGEADLSPGIGISEERKEHLVFTETIDAFPVSFFVRSQNREFDETRGSHLVGVIGGSVAYEHLKKFSNLHLALYDSFQQGLFDLLSGKIDAFACPAPTFVQLARESGVEDRLKIAGRPITEIKRAIALRQDNLQLLEKINKAVRNLVGRAEYQRIYVKWYGTPTPFWTSPRVGITGAVLALIIISSMLVWRHISIRRLNRELLAAHADLERKVDERTSELGISNEELEHEITAHQATEEALRESEERYHALFNQSPDGILLIDADGNLVEFNERTHRQLGYTREEFAGLSISDLDPNESPDEIRDRISKVSSEGKAEFEVEHRTKEGEIRNVQVITQTIKIAGRAFLHTIWRDTTDRKRALEALRDSERLYRLLFENNPHPMWIYDRDTLCYLAVNDAAIAHYGYSLEEFRSMTIKDIRPREDVPVLLSSISKMRSGIYDSGSWKHKKKDGTIIDVEIISHNLDFDGKRARVVLAHDITERKKVEAALQESEHKFRTFFESANDALFILDLEGHFIDINRTAYERLGYTKEEMLSMHVSQLDPPAYAAKVAPRIEKVKKDGHAVIESAHRKKDGTIMPVEINVRIVDFAGEKVLYSIVRDITERTQAEETLRKSERQLRESQEVAKLGNWDLDLVSQKLEWSDEAYKLFDKSPEDFMPSFNEFARMVHPDDRATMQMNFNRALESDASPYHVTVRIINDSGREWVLEALGIVRRDLSGKAFCIFGTAQDITERKQMERLREESEEKFRTLFEFANDALFIIDMQGNILDTNMIAYERLGYTKKELLSLNLSQLDHPSFAATVPERMERLKQYGRIQIELAHVRKDGSVMPVEINARAMDLNGGKVIFSVIRDITERKQTETTLKETNAKLQALIQALPDAVYFKDMGGRYLMINNAFEHITGARQEMVIGKTDGDFMPADIAEGCRKSDEELMKSGGQIQIMDTLIGDDGRKTYLESVKVPVKDSKENLLGLVGMTRDITTRKQAEETLRAAVMSAEEEKAKTEAFISAIGDGITVHGTDFRIIYQNQVTNDFYGNRVGEYCYKAYHNRDAICENCHFPETLKDGRVRKVEGMRNAAEGLIYYEITSSPLRDAAGKIIGGIELFRDITSRKNAEEVLRRSHEELEILVEERTAELTMMNEQLRGFSTYLQEARESERTNIAREIHDELGQSLTAIKMDLSLLSKKLPKDQKLVREKTASMAELIEATIQSVKRISTELRPGILDHLGLTAAIEWQASEFEKRTGITCNITFEPEDMVIDRHRSTTIFRIFQETLTNVTRHAKASNVGVHLKHHNGELMLNVKDDGKGITEKQMADTKSLGLIGIRERVHYWGGSLTISGTLNKGTMVAVRIPLDGTGTALN